MNRLKRYIKPALYNILQNKIYALFCIIGTALTFVFITLILQLTYSLISNQPPSNNADRVLQFSDFYDTKGNYIGGLKPEEMTILLDNLKNVEACSYLNGEMTTFTVDDKLYTGDIAFVNGDFWIVNNFKFLKGRNFNSKECDERKKYIVIKESISKTCFRSADVLSKKIMLQGNEYEIIGVVDDFSYFSSPSETATMWIPYTYNKFVPSYSDYYTYAILFPEDSQMSENKEKLIKAINENFEKKNLSTDIRNINTLKEKKIESVGSNFFAYGVIIAIVILLIIPALNIVTLNTANTNNRAEEIAVKRAMGASRLSAFFQILLENFIQVFMGSMLGLLLMKPAVKLVESILLGEVLADGITLVSEINYQVVFLGVFPLILIFTILSGGIPAYFISRLNIVDVLKGGTK